MTSITADIIVFKREWILNDFKKNVQKNSILLIKRSLQQEVFPGEASLPGGFVNVENELVIDGAVRELYEETGLIVDKSWLEFVSYYDAVNRDPRGRTLSFAFSVVLTNPQVVAGDDAIDHKWVDINGSARTILAFDHKKIVMDACNKLGLEYSINF